MNAGVSLSPLAWRRSVEAEVLDLAGRGHADDPLAEPTHQTLSCVLSLDSVGECGFLSPVPSPRDGSPGTASTPELLCSQSIGSLDEELPGHMAGGHSWQTPVRTGRTSSAKGGILPLGTRALLDEDGLQPAVGTQRFAACVGRGAPATPGVFGSRSLLAGRSWLRPQSSSFAEPLSSRTAATLPPPVAYAVTATPDSVSISLSDADRPLVSGGTTDYPLSQSVPATPASPPSQMHHSTDDDTILFDSVATAGLPARLAGAYRDVSRVDELYPWQRACLREYFGRGRDGGPLADGAGHRHLLYSAPTGGGKTIVAEIIMFRTLLAAARRAPVLMRPGAAVPLDGGEGAAAPPPPGRKALFVVPYVALAEEKVAALERVAAAVDLHVKCHAGGKGHRVLTGDVLVCTPEKANVLLNLFLEARREDDIGVVLIDEMHQLGDSGRGHVLELLLTKLIHIAAGQRARCAEARGTPEQPLPSPATPVASRMSGVTTAPATARDHLWGGVRLVAMSATLSNSALLARWMGDAHFFVTDFRPVPLREYYTVRGGVFDSRHQPVRTIQIPPTPVPPRPGAQRRADPLPVPAPAPDEQLPRLSDCRLREFDLGVRAALVALPEAQRIREAVFLSLALEALAGGFQCLVFCPTRADCAIAAALLLSAVRHAAAAGGPTLEALAHEKHVDAAAGRAELQKLLRTALAPGDPAAPLADELPVGVAFHHAALTTGVRAIVEAGFREGAIWCLCCTTTLAAGVNLPARRVVFRAPRVGATPLDTIRYRQAAGRAGRPGLDTAGEAFLIGQQHEAPLLRRLVSAALPPVASNFCPRRRGLLRALLEAISTGRATTVTALHKFLGATLLAAAGEESAVAAARVALEYLESCRFIDWVESGERAPEPPESDAGGQADLSTGAPSAGHFECTALGDAAAAAGFAPDEALAVRSAMQRARRRYVLGDELHTVYLCTPLVHGLSTQWAALLRQLTDASVAAVGEAVGVQEAFVARCAEMGAPNPRTGGGAEADADAHRLLVHQRFYAALVLRDVVREVPLGEVAQAARVSVAELHRLMEAGSAFASMAGTFATRLGWWYFAPLFERMAPRLQRGAEPDILPLLAIPGLAAWRARELFRRGFQTVVSIAVAPEAQLRRVVSAKAPVDSAGADGEGSDGAVVEGRRGVAAPDAVARLVRLLVTGAKAAVKAEAAELTEAADSLALAVMDSAARHTSPTRIIKPVLQPGCGDAAPPTGTRRSLKRCRSASGSQSGGPVFPFRGSGSRTFAGAVGPHLSDVSRDVPIPDLPSEPAVSISESAGAVECRRAVLNAAVPAAVAALADALDSLFPLDNDTTTYAGFTCWFADDWQALGFSLCAAVSGPRGGSVLWTIRVENVRATDRATGPAVWATIGCLLHRRAICKVVHDAQGTLRRLARMAARGAGVLFAGGAARHVPVLLGLVENLFDPLVADWVLDPDDRVGGRTSSVASLCARHFGLSLADPEDASVDNDTAAALVRRLAGRLIVGDASPGEAGAASAAAALLLVTMRLLRVLEHDGLLRPALAVEMPVIPALALMEALGVGFDGGDYRVKLHKMEEKRRLLEAEAFAETGRSGWDLTAPRRCAEMLFDVLKLPPLESTSDAKHLPRMRPRRARRLETRSTNAAVLRNLQLLRPEVRLPFVIQEHRTLAGWAERYMRPLLEAAQQATVLPSVAVGGRDTHAEGQRPAGRVLGRFFHSATATGRLAMAEPNLQTIPHPITFDLGTETVPLRLRSAFVPSGGTYTVLLGADYAQIEARLLAHLSGDAALRGAFASGTDVFVALAARLWGRPPVLLSPPPSEASEFDGLTPGGVTPEQRRRAKTLCYGMLYGKGAGAIAEDLGIRVDDARLILHQFREAYPVAHQYAQGVAEQARMTGFVETLTGRRRYLRHASSKDGRAKAASARMAINTVCQGTAADVVKIAMARIIRQLAEGAGGGLVDARLVLQIHDELLFEVQPDRLRAVATLVQGAMTDAAALQLTVPMEVKLKAGPTWDQMTPLSLD